jgi:hypothetical protein
VFETYPAAPNVTCCICGQLWNPADPRVDYRSIDRRWWCADETDCTDRRARMARLEAHGTSTPPGTLAAMYRALDQVWAELEQQGWRV